MAWFSVYLTLPRGYGSTQLVRDSWRRWSFHESRKPLNANAAGNGSAGGALCRGSGAVGAAGTGRGGASLLTVAHKPFVVDRNYTYIVEQKAL